MERYAVFVDAGYLLAAGSQAINGGQGVQRHEIRLNCAQVITTLRDKGRLLADADRLLRIYWYDGAFVSGLTVEQTTLGFSDNVKLRLGLVNGLDQQKGVDSRIVTDMAELARKRAVCDAVLVSGDDDLRIGVQIAQEYGVRVHLLSVTGVKPAALLRREADTTTELSARDVQTFLSLAPQASANAPDAPEHSAAQADIPSEAAREAATFAAESVASYLDTLDPGAREALSEAVRFSGTIPKEHDGRLLARTRTLIGRELDPDERVVLRQQLKTNLGL